MNTDKMEFSKSVFTAILLPILLLFEINLSQTAFGREKRASFSGAIIGSFEVHHVYIEDEQRKNF